VRTNCESLIGVRVPGSREDLSQGIAIGSGFYLDEHTHIEATRYPAGSDAMGLLATVLTGGEPGRKRILLWIRGLITSLSRHPIRTTRILHPFGWARESIILLCMQTLDGHISMRLGRPWFWPFRRVLRSHGERIPTFIAGQPVRPNWPGDRRYTDEHGDRDPFDVPGTAHILGDVRWPLSGARSGGFAERLFGYQEPVRLRRLIAANLGVNPSLTICALAERR
jgi:cholesterol oxidase